VKWKSYSQNTTIEISLDGPHRLEIKSVIEDRSIEMIQHKGQRKTDIKEK
jgi:recombinational DNA repair ATPase RecF